MKIAIEKISPNPFRDFGIYPIEEEQVQRLTQSIDELGFFSGVTARKHRNGHTFELAAGHHRLEAAKRAGLTVVEAVVEAYTDEEMVRIMAVENLSQRGHSAAAINDSVAAFCRIVAKAILLGGEDSAKFLAVSDERFLTKAQTDISQDGPGSRLVYRAINGFDKADRKVNKEAEQITSTEIDAALSALKASGGMARVMTDVMVEVDAAREERDAKAKAEADRKAAAEKRAAEQAEAEAKRKAAAEAKAKAEAEAAAKRASKAVEDRKAAQAARDAQVAADKAKREREAADRKAAAEREAADKAAKERQDADHKRSEQRATQAASVKAQAAVPPTYDARCVNEFRLPTHESAFRKSVLSEQGMKFIPRSEQLALAKSVRARIDKAEREHSHDVGSKTVSDIVGETITTRWEAHMKVNRSASEEAAKLRSDTQKINDLWIEIRRSITRAEKDFGKLTELFKKWPHGKGTFPVDMDSVVRIVEMGERFAKLKNTITGGF